MNEPTAYFDSRAFTIPDPIEVENYFIWRQQDATRNSVSMTAHAHFAHEELQGKTSDEMQEMLWQEKGINWNDMPVGFKRGRCVVKQQILQDKQYVDTRTGENTHRPRCRTLCLDACRAACVYTRMASVLHTAAKGKLMPTVLLTGFAPFGGYAANPSQQIAERLNGETIGGLRVVGLALPVSMGEDADLLTAAIADHKPTLVLSLGLSAGATCLEVERFAVNLRYAENIDPSRPMTPNQPQCPIIADGLCALSGTIDAEQIAAAIREKAGVPAWAHSYAGAYACNHIFYQALHYAQQWDLSYCAGFIHLPLSSEQAVLENKLHLPSLPLELMVVGIRAAIEEANI